MLYKRYYVTVDHPDYKDDVHSELQAYMGNEFIPIRSVECVDSQPGSLHNGIFLLSDDEAQQLANDPRVRSVEQPTADRGLFPSHQGSRTGPFDRSTTITYGMKNWALSRCINNYDNFTSFNSTSSPYTYNLDGTGVDVIVMDTGVEPSHPEFAVNADGTGGSRVVNYDWSQHGYLSVPTGGFLGDCDGHGSNCGSIAAGVTCGWAPGAAVYTLRTVGSGAATEKDITDGRTLGLLDEASCWQSIRAFHIAKNSPQTISSSSFSAAHSTWTFGAGTISLQSTTLPYHSYGNYPSDPNVPSSQGVNKTFPYRGGTNSGNANGTAATSLGNVGYWLNGVNMFNFSAAGGAPNGYTTFTHLNYNASYEAGVELNYTFGEDYAGGHAAPGGAYHYHDFSFASSWLNGQGHVTGAYGTTGTADASLISYLNGSLTHPDGHSKILGFTLDGYPMYGPYGYSSATNALSKVTIMKSGYAVYTSPSQVSGRVTDGVLNTSTYPMGMFIQDYHFVGGGDLDTNNGRYCVTPDYPNGTYAYFCTISTSTGKPVFPYVVGNTYYSTPAAQQPTQSTSGSGGGSAPTKTPTYRPTIVTASYGYFGTTPTITSITYRGNTINSPTTQQKNDCGLLTFESTYNTRVSYIEADIQACLSAGVIVVSAAGNNAYKIDLPSGQDYNNYFNGSSSNAYHQGTTPSACPGVICVGAMDNKTPDHKVYFSCTGPRVDIYSPGVMIMGAYSSATYVSAAIHDPRNTSYYLNKISGTSQATPNVTGLSTLYLSLRPQSTATDLLKWLASVSVKGQLNESYYVGYTLSGVNIGTGTYTNLASLQGSVNGILYLPYHLPNPLTIY